MIVREPSQRIRYLTRCLIDVFRPSLRCCPCCGSSDVLPVKRKRLLTTLVRCRSCCLLFRLPRDRDDFGRAFYQDRYESGFTTTCPQDEELSEMLATHFRGTSKNLARKLEVLSALRSFPPTRILDFGASWGYGTWQLRQAGFQAEGFEISQRRAQFGREKLAVPLSSDLKEIHGPFDVFLSIHVLEHVPSPTFIFDLARRLLRSGGLFIAYTPNGSAEFMRADSKRYHRAWGRLHPLYLDDAFYCHQFQNRPKLLTSCETGRQVDLTELETWDQESDRVFELTKSELLAVIKF